MTTLRGITRRGLVLWMLLAILTACAAESHGPPPTARPVAPGGAPPVPTSDPHLVVMDPKACSRPRSGQVWADSPLAPLSLAQFVDRSVAIAVVSVAYDSGYWAPLRGAFGPSPDLPSTATDFRVITPVSGSLPGWIQGKESGALPGSLPRCDGAGYVLDGEPIPAVGSQYVLFLFTNLGGGRYGPTDSDHRFQIIGGRVYSGAHLRPFGLQLLDVNGTPLLDFLAAIRQYL
ncbi:MAG: hypothetical protein ACYDAC_08075 [Candidatus Dormibacteria bacterium]